ncbi:DUF2191 domain-containing protein [Propioniciclava soli]|uniref:DUF2191 domain-containing protein n=1 Tax=Propioniciclava soli TaxID=2775081 RepID=A0ABZ3C719_9ACTN|nr:DUF2191 domain-containing protein [Propioniciclava soli]
MRTTLELSDDVMAVARALAAAKGVSLGTAVSDLARQGIQQRTAPTADVSYSPFPILIGPPGHVVTDDLVAEHRDD